MEIVKLKKCGKCRVIQPISEFYPSKDGYRSRCKTCHREDAREYYKTEHYLNYKKEYVKRPEVRRRIREKKAEYRQRPEVRIKNLARWYVHHEIRAGRLKREPCALCGKPQGQAHHNDYTQPLLIVWLCDTCHRGLHFSSGKG